MSGRRYTLRRVLGQGAQGTVYLADLSGEAGFSRQVALKLIREGLDQRGAYARRLRDEARLLALVRHRAVVHVDALIQIGGQWAIVLEFVDGVSLADLLQLGPLPLGAALEVMAEVAAALHAAGAARGPEGQVLQLCHRDLKPGNVLLTGAGEVKVLDFGIARAPGVAREARTRAAGVIGTPGYLAPEALDGSAQVGPPADVFALGVLLSELLLGQPVGQLWPDPETWELRVEALADRSARAVEELHPPAGPALRALLRSLLERAPDRRPSAREVDRALLDLRARIPAEPLRYWAERAVPEARAHVPLPSGEGDPLLGRTLSEGGAEEFGPGPAATTLVPEPERSGGAPTPERAAPAARTTDATEDDEVDEVLDPAEAPMPRVAARPAPRPAAPAPAGPLPMDPGATFVGARGKVLSGLMARQDTEIRVIPKEKRPAPPPPPLPVVGARAEAPEVAAPAPPGALAARPRRPRRRPLLRLPRRRRSARRRRPPTRPRPARGPRSRRPSPRRRRPRGPRRRPGHLRPRAGAAPWSC
jgi:tRNA A-37 threonylcarbamoyl transferase component Bud32